MADLYERVSSIALSFPEVVAKESHGSPCFFLRGKTSLCYFHGSGSHGNDRPSLWCRATAGVNDEMSAAEPQRFFRPQASASGVFSDWLGMYLDEVEGEEVDWAEVAAVLREAYVLIAPKKLVAQLDAD